MTDNTKPTVATNTEFTSRGGEVLLVANGSDTFHLLAGPTGPSLIFSHTDAPAIALAILTAAGVKASASIDPSSWQQCVEVAAGHLDDAILIAAGEAAK